MRPLLAVPVEVVGHGVIIPLRIVRLGRHMRWPRLSSILASPAAHLAGTPQNPMAGLSPRCRVPSSFHAATEGVTALRRRRMNPPAMTRLDPNKIKVAGSGSTSDWILGTSTRKCRALASAEPCPRDCTNPNALREFHKQSTHASSGTQEGDCPLIGGQLSSSLGQSKIA